MVHGEKWTILTLTLTLGGPPFRKIRERSSERTSRGLLWNWEAHTQFWRARRDLKSLWNGWED